MLYQVTVVVWCAGDKLDGQNGSLRQWEIPAFPAADASGSLNSRCRLDVSDDADDADDTDDADDADDDNNVRYHPDQGRYRYQLYPRAKCRITW